MTRILWLVSLLAWIGNLVIDLDRGKRGYVLLDLIMVANFAVLALTEDQ